MEGQVHEELRKWVTEAQPPRQEAKEGPVEQRAKVELRAKVKQGARAETAD